MSRKGRALVWSILLLVSAGVVWGARTPAGRALARSTRSFQPLAGDERVHYEPGAERMAGSVASYLDTAVARVEAALGAPFPEPFDVYVCATQASLNAFIGLPPSAPIRGTVRFGDLFIAPSAFDWQGVDLHRESVSHELTHLYLRQRLGTLTYLGRVPPWFHEAIADLVSGAGGEGISEAEATLAIRDGRALRPDSTGSLRTLGRASGYGLPGPMLHRQSRMFIAYLRDRDVDAFSRFLSELQERRSFAAAFRGSFGGSVAELWSTFVAGLPEAGGP